MNYEEALEWLKGTRSMINSIEGSDSDLRQVRTAQADAAMTEMAYWIVRAHKEMGLN
jgi:hypothetical protein